MCDAHDKQTCPDVLPAAGFHPRLVSPYRQSLSDVGSSAIRSPAA